ncbi:unnamed protein product [Effrenium voratum]|nr:unnamed protein product [Effrenium voratum]
MKEARVLRIYSRFRALKSWVWDEGEVVRLSDLHRGALLQPADLQDVRVVNMRLQVAKAQNWMASNGADFLRRKGQRGRTFKSLDGHEVQINDEQKFHYVVLNARCAPAADVATLLKLERGPGFVAECIQANNEMQRSMHL